MLGRRRLRVAVDPGLRGLSPRTGHGRVWVSVLRELDGLVRLRDPGVRVDVALVDGHAAPVEGLGVPEVAFMSEAPWDDPEAAFGLSAAFVEVVGGATRAAAARAARVIVPSRASGAQVTDGLRVPADRVDVVAHGVDSAAFAGDGARGRARVGAPYVLFASQLHPRKNLPALRAALAGLDRTLVVVGAPAADREGDDATEAALLASGPDLPVVRLDAAADAALADLYAGADAVCLPSRFEGFGLTALEAMAAGAILVVSDRGALPEVVGDAGLIATPEPDALRAALQAAFGRDDLRDRARRRAAPMTWAATAAGWHAALRRAT